MVAVPRFDTHEVLNQSPPYADVDLFLSDRPLQEAVRADGAEAVPPGCLASWSLGVLSGAPIV